MLSHLRQNFSILKFRATFDLQSETKPVYQKDDVRKILLSGVGFEVDKTYPTVYSLFHSQRLLIFKNRGQLPIALF